MEDYFYQIDKQKIKNTLEFLKKRLPKKCTKYNYQLLNTFLTTEVKFGMTIQEKLQKVADSMREHLFIDEPIKIITIKNIEAGKFEMIDDLNCIYINENTSTQDFFQKIAILAHEMSHYYLIRKHGILKENEKENKLLTEINTVYCGFGLILFEGYKNIKTNRGKYTLNSKVGYINLDVIKETIIQTAYIRKQKPQFIMDNLNLNIIDKLITKWRFKELNKEYKKAIKRKHNNM